MRECFTDPVGTNYTSLGGGQPETKPVDDLIAEWTEFASGFGATQHLTGPLLVSGDHVQTHVTAHHWPRHRAGVVVHGHYIAQLAGGKIAEFTLHTFYVGGDPSLPTIPAQRAVTALKPAHSPPNRPAVGRP